jgi:hypothetical protein
LRGGEARRQAKGLKITSFLAACRFIGERCQLLMLMFLPPHNDRSGVASCTAPQTELPDKTGLVDVSTH